MEHNKVRINVFHTGQVYVDPSVPRGEKNPFAFTGLFRDKSKRLWLPVSAYLIEHPQGLVLVDTGWNTLVRTEEKKHLGYASISDRARLPEGEAVTEQMKRLGYQPSDLEYVLLSHMDLDHTSGLSMVKEAKHIMCSEEEWKDTKKFPVRYKNYWKETEIERFIYEPSHYGPVNRSYDLFGDESILLISTPGHSHGIFTVQVRNSGKFVLLIGDVGYMRASWEKQILPGIVADKKAEVKSLEWVKKMSEQEDCVEILANHDQEVVPHVVEL